MPEDKRQFEASSSVPVEIKPRTRRKTSPGGTGGCAGEADPQTSSRLPVPSRRTVLRLIDWFKSES